MTPDKLSDVEQAKEHRPTLHGLLGDRCGSCRERWPCLVERLRLEVERLRGLIVEAARLQAINRDREGGEGSIYSTLIDAEARIIREGKPK